MTSPTVGLPLPDPEPVTEINPSTDSKTVANDSPFISGKVGFDRFQLPND